MAYFEQTNINNDRGQTVNPATEEQIVLLRRIVKLMESQATVDVANRQRIAIDAVGAGITVPVSIGAALPAGANTIGSVNIGLADHRQFIDMARTAYNTGIRSKLTFS
jgi:hypothetical protein